MPPWWLHAKLKTWDLVKSQLQLHRESQQKFGKNALSFSNVINVFQKLGLGDFELKPCSFGKGFVVWHEVLLDWIYISRIPERRKILKVRRQPYSRSAVHYKPTCWRAWLVYTVLQGFSVMHMLKFFSSPSSGSVSPRDCVSRVRWVDFRNCYFRLIFLDLFL